VVSRAEGVGSRIEIADLKEASIGSNATDRSAPCSTEALPNGAETILRTYADRSTIPTRFPDDGDIRFTPCPPVLARAVAQVPSRTDWKRGPPPVP